MDNRNLILRWAMHAGQPVLLSATIASCGGNVVVTKDADSNTTSDVADSGSTTRADSSSTDTSIVIDTSTDTADTCSIWSVFLPPEGVDANQAAICASTDNPVVSNDFAYVNFNSTPTATLWNVGIYFRADEWILASTPSVNIVSGAAIAGAVTWDSSSNEVPQFPLTFSTTPRDGDAVTLQINCAINCEGGVKPMTTTITLAYCAGEGGWVGGYTNNTCNECPILLEPAPSTVSQPAGDSCTDCSVICEMAPSPIVPNALESLPLGRVHKIKVRPIARVGRSIVLYAIHDGESIDWQADSGRLQMLAGDIAVWTAGTCDIALIRTTAQSEFGLAIRSIQLAA